MITKKTIAAWISEKRKETGITQETLAKEAEISRGHLSNIENGWDDPTALVLSNIAAAIDSFECSQLLSRFKKATRSN